MSDQDRFTKLKEAAKRHPLLMTTVSSVLLGVGAIILWSPFLGYGLHLSDLFSIPIVGITVGLFLVYPVLLTGIELYLLLRLGSGREKNYSRYRIFDIVTILLGILYSLLYIGLVHSVSFQSDWTVTLVNAQTHTPVYTQDVSTVLAVALVGFAGYLIVSFLPLEKMPPLTLVLGMSAMYLGTAESVLWAIQVCRELGDLPLLLLPINCVLITARAVLCKVRQWGEIPRNRHKVNRIPLLKWCDRVLDNASLWPLAAFLLMWPLLGILIGVLVLFGQSPDAIIRAWTETSDWNLSQRVAPQNIYYDEHYLCTVAAGGHRKIVKPLRLGIRHGHEVIVNRQLCIANAFEQILEEKTPRLHKAVRGVYDKYGFPIARCIHSPYTADAIYYLMKPLEWFFLVVLYLTDVHPEDRIAVQYAPGRFLP